MLQLNFLTFHKIRCTMAEIYFIHLNTFNPPSSNTKTRFYSKSCNCLTFWKEQWKVTDCAVMAVPTTNSCGGLWVSHCRAGKADRDTNQPRGNVWVSWREVITSFWVKTCSEICNYVHESTKWALLCQTVYHITYCQLFLSHSNNKDLVFAQFLWRSKSLTKGDLIFFVFVSHACHIKQFLCDFPIQVCTCSFSPEEICFKLNLHHVPLEHIEKSFNLS